MKGGRGFRFSLSLGLFLLCASLISGGNSVRFEKEGHWNGIPISGLCCISENRTKCLEVWNMLLNPGRHIKRVTFYAKGYYGCRISYYPNSTRSFNLQLIACGDISVNPGPSKCPTCTRTVAVNHRATDCDSCRQRFHIKCGLITATNFRNFYKDDKDRLWTCPKCILNMLAALPCQEDLLADIFSTEEKEIYANEDSIPLSLCKALPEITKQRMKDSREILVMHLNVNSLQNKIEEVRLLIEQFGAQVVFLTETKIDASYPNSQFAINNYHIYRNDRVKGGGGLMAYFASVLPSKKLKQPRMFKTIEVLMIQSNFGGKDVIVMGIYRSPKATGKDYYLTLEKELHEICTWISLQNQFIIIMGDLNLNKLRPEDKEGKILCDLEEVHGLECLIKEATRVTDNGATLLDVILTNEQECFGESGVYNPEISDHHTVYAVLKDKAIQHKSRILKVRSYKNFDEDAFKEDLRIAPWHVGGSFDSLDDRYGYWNTLVNDIVDEHLPTRSIRVRARNVPYMTREWKNAIKAKRRYSKKFSKNPTSENFELKRKWRNEATKQRRIAIKQYWKKVSHNIKSDPRKFYKTFRPFIDFRNKQGDSNDISLKIHDTLEVDQNVVANHFVNYFSTMADRIGGDYVKNCNEEDFKNHNSLHNIVTKLNEKDLPSDHFEFKELSCEEIRQTMHNLNSNKSRGYDKMDPKILKIGANELAPPLAEILNQGIREGNWITQLKRGEWIPVYKKDDRQQEVNYRPITVLPCVDKVYEALLGQQVSKFMDERLSDAITAYRVKNSCETTLIRLIENWKVELDSRRVVGVLSSDMSKAFDSLSPQLLINKLQTYQFSEEAVQLIRSYFKGRENRVRIGTVTSDWVMVKRGCPQGSTFGPLMWNIFQNDLPNIITEANVSMYADDHQIYVAKETIESVEKILVENGKKMTKWYQDNLLKVNCDKYQAMVLGSQKDARKVDMDICGEKVEQTQSIKILGVNLDENLNFSYHIGEICKKVSRLIGILRRLKNLIPVSAKLLLYKSAIMPHLTYCHLVWHFCRASDSRKLERLQERALRFVYDNTNDSYDALLKKAKLSTLQNRRLQDILILMFKVKNKLTVNYVSDIFNINDANTRRYDLRNDDFVLPRFNTVSYGKHSLRFLGPKLWSKLSKEERHIESLGAFKSMIRKKDITSLLEGCGRECRLCLS